VILTRLDLRDDIAAAGRVSIQHRIIGWMDSTFTLPLALSVAMAPL